MGCCGSKPKPTSNSDGRYASSSTPISHHPPQHQHQQQQQTLPVQTQQPQKVSAPPTRPEPQHQPKPQPPPKPVVLPNSILEKPFDDIKQYYTLGKELGRGQFGITYLCTENSTEQQTMSVPTQQHQKISAPPTRPEPQHQPKPQPPPKPVVLPNRILEKPFDDIKQYYTLGKELGRGQFGITYLCTENSTGNSYACKSILKRNLVSKNDRDDVKREIQIMQHMSGQPNVVEIKGAYEDRYSVHLVMELCAGGQLFDRIIAQGVYSERAAAAIVRDIVNVVHSCHFMAVMHRDLKPENFLLSKEGKGAMLKVTDFGLSVFIEEGKVYRDIVGSPYYVAPEVLRRNYGKEIDIWSAGVILYILLGGVPPFWAETREGIFDAILEGVVDFESQPWPSISDGAKDLVKKMLTQDPKRRITSLKVLEHPWLREGGEASDKPIDSPVLARIYYMK